MDLSANSRFQMCPETSKQASIIKRDDCQKLVQIPEHIYESFSVHSSLSNTKANLISPWAISDEKPDSFVTDQCNSNQPYSSLNLLTPTAARLDAVYSIQFSIESVSAKSSLVMDGGKMGKNKKVFSNSKFKNKVKANTSPRESVSARSPRTSSRALKSGGKFPFSNNVKDIPYKFSCSMMDYGEHAALYRNSYTYKMINEFHELRGTNNNYRTTAFDRDLFIAKFRRRNEKKIQECDGKPGIAQPIFLTLTNRVLMKPQDHFTKISSQQNEPRRCHSAKCVECKIKNNHEEDQGQGRKTSPPSPQVDEEIIPSMKQGVMSGEQACNIKKTVQSIADSKTSKQSISPSSHFLVTCSTLSDYIVNQSLPKSQPKSSKSSLTGAKTRSRRSSPEKKSQILLSTMSSGNSVSQIRKSIQEAGSLIKPMKAYIRNSKK